LITKPSVLVPAASESAYDYSGRAVSSAGDVNGDGLDDLIVGAYSVDPSNKSNAGKSYVIDGISVGFAEDDIRFACVWLAAWIGLISTYN
jgi:hypothetical protein